MDLLQTKKVQTSPFHKLQEIHQPMETSININKSIYIIYIYIYSHVRSCISYTVHDANKKLPPKKPNNHDFHHLSFQKHKKKTYPKTCRDRATGPRSNFSLKFQTDRPWICVGSQAAVGRETAVTAVGAKKCAVSFETCVCVCVSVCCFAERVVFVLFVFVPIR